MGTKMIKYENAQGVVIHDGEWVNNGGVNEWDSKGENPLDIKTYRTEKLNCHFDVEGNCIHIGDKDLSRVIGIHSSEARKVYTNPMEGRFIKI